MVNTIIALVTPHGRSGIGVIRMSGPEALEIATKLAATGRGFQFTPRLAYLKHLFDPQNGDVIDEAIITYFKAPHSFTGEDIVEISCHGSPILLRQVIDLCLTLGARLADAGEFSLRALANGRMNLAEAEAIRDLIDAQSTASARLAIRQLRGEFSHHLAPLNSDLLDVIVTLESALEFVEDDLPDLQKQNVRTRLEAAASSIAKLAATFKAGKLIREGLRVALTGRPNVGKSSLFNTLIGSDRAIVTEIAGTTRDQIHEKFTIGNIPISLIDTAGLRETTDTVESIGVERSRRAMADADLVLAIFDSSEQFLPEDEAILGDIGELNHIIVFNKSDKIDVMSQNIVARFPQIAAARRVSAKTGFGIDELKQEIVDKFSPEDIESGSFLVTDARHHDLLQHAHSEILSSLDLLDAHASEEIVLIGLHNALRYIGQITGETTTEDMLTRIFSTFCIGK